MKSWKASTGRILIPAGGSAPGTVAIGADADFEVDYLTGEFSTLSGGADVGFCVLSARLYDAGAQTWLFDNFIPLSLLLTPGRTLTALAGNPSAPLFWPLDLKHRFIKNGTIQVEFRSNAAVTDNFAEICFHGHKV